MSNTGKIITTAAALLVLAFIAAISVRGKDHADRARALDASILDVLSKNGLDEGDLRYKREEISHRGRHSYLKIVRHYDVPNSFDGDAIAQELRRIAKKLKIPIAKSAVEKGKTGESSVFYFSLNGEVVYELKFQKGRYAFAPAARGKKAKIAIVIDDCGYSMNNIDSLFGIGVPVTVSILPNLAFSRQVAEEAGRRGRDVILHLPLEPHGDLANLEKGTIMVDMPPEEIKGLLKEAIENIPGLKGVSNHMGSRATEDRAFMRALFVQLKKRGLFFLDNLVTDKSVCREIAEEVGLPTASRSVFLDNESEDSYIEGQLLRTARAASRNGWAIGVGHDRPHTIKALAQMVPRLKKEGYEFVRLSELVE